jgi:hypothetical protein
MQKFKELLKSKVLLLCHYLPVNSLYNYTGRDCLVDFVEISGRSSKRFCGKNTPPSFTPDLNVVKLRFSTDETGEQKGFDLNFTSVLGK